MEEKYISTNRAVVVLKQKCEQGLIDFATADSIAGFIDKQPAADVEEVRHGKWARQDGRPEAICPECGRDVVYQVIDNRWQFENFCPHCGMKMDDE